VGIKEGVNEMQNIDHVDLTILKSLQANSRASFQEIAKQIGVSRVTIYDRVRRLTDSGIIKGFHIGLNASELGYPVTAMVGLIAAQGREAYRTMADLKKIEEVEEIYVTTGHYDYLIKVRARSNMDLQDILLNKIDQIYGFQRAETMIALSTPSEQCGIRIDRIIEDLQEMAKTLD
jgi:Lrp/AsnC family transcriptional regulator, regulator for asnA, asnC and gidA